MKTKKNKSIPAQILPIGCFIFLLLNISVDCSSLMAAAYDNGKLHLRLNSAIFSAADSSGNDLLSVNYILNNKQTDTEEAFQLESWMVHYDSYQNSDVANAYQHSLTDETISSYEDWMSNPEMFTIKSHQDTPGDEIQAEEEISFESWMINTSSWKETQSCH